MIEGIAGAIIFGAFFAGAKLGWNSDWARRLFRMGPYRKTPKVPYHWKD